MNVPPSCVVWQKAMRSMGDGACVEVAQVADMVAVRDSKDPHGAMLMYTREEWSAFLDGAQNGEFDHFC